MDKTAPKYKLDASGNIVNGPPSAADEKPKSNGFAALFAGGAGASSAAGGFGVGATGGGFVFGGASAEGEQSVRPKVDLPKRNWETD